MLQRPCEYLLGKGLCRRLGWAVGDGGRHFRGLSGMVPVQLSVLRERDYMILLRTYSCSKTDINGILKSNVFEHHTSIFAAREVTG